MLRAWFFRRFRTRRLRKRLGCIESASLEQIVTWARLDRYQSKLVRELEVGQAEHRRLQTTVGDPATSAREADRNWAEASLCAIRADSAARIRSGADRLASFARAAAGGGSFKRTVANSLDSLRGWACTALSASPNFPLESGLFDLVIVDEASQCSLAAVLPLAYRAKRLVVVGDPCQLQPIVPIGDRLLQDIAIRTGLVSDDLRRRGIHHKDGSAYLAFEIAVRPHTPGSAQRALTLPPAHRPMVQPDFLPRRADRTDGSCGDDPARPHHPVAGCGREQRNVPPPEAVG